MEDIANELLASSVVAGKIDQTGISVPISLAAVGEPNYADIYSETEAAGFRADNAYIPKVTMPRVEGEMTGGAAPVDYRALASQIAVEEDLDPDLFGALVNQESGYNPKAISKAGAIGLTQLMPATAKGLGVDPHDPIQNLRDGARYLKTQLNEFKDPALALAAYNAGPGAVKKAGGIPNFRETQNYVKNIMGKVKIGNAYPIDYSFRNHSDLINRDTGLLDQKRFNDLLYLIQNGSGFK